MKGSGIVIMVRDLHELQGKSISAIARELKLSRTTVRKYLKEGLVPDKRVGTKRSSKLDPYKDEIQRLMNLGIYNSVTIYERILELGYEGKLSILKDYMRPLRPAQVKEGPAVRRYETKPGTQAQMDWGICKYKDPRGRIRRVACFVMVLGYSRMRYVEFCPSCNLANLLRCMVHAFEYFDGIPEQILTDHMKTVVNHSNRKETVWQAGFEHFATELGFVPKLCRVRRPQTKGKVERLVGYVKGGFMPGREFLDVVDLNRQAMHWLSLVNGKVHSTTGERPFDLLAEEGLKPLPLDGRHQHYEWEERKVSSDGFVSYNGVKYGVHWSYSGERLHVRVMDGKIYICNSDREIVQEHDRWRSGRKYIFAKGQYEGLLIAEGQAGPKSYGRQIEYDEVEVRDLNSYVALAGVK